MIAQRNEPQIIALLGRQDEPTDAVRDYCYWLSQALGRRGVTLATVRVRWDRLGWQQALLQLWQESKSWRGKTVLVQYTPLAWSKRGLPIGALAILAILNRRQARCMMVFHDAVSVPGNRWIDRIRHACQDWVVRRAHRVASRCIFTIALERVPWLPADRRKAVFIPVGANMPECLAADENPRRAADRAMTVAVFGVTGGAARFREAPDIAYAMSQARTKIPRLQLVVFGRGSEDATDALREAFNGTSVDVAILGLLSGEELARTLAAADVFLFVRGPISTRRGSAIAGIVCGLPIVGYLGDETDFPITEAGVELVPLGNREALADALSRVLTDESLRRQLRRKSLQARDAYFSWDRIAELYQTVLDNA